MSLEEFEQLNIKSVGGDKEGFKLPLFAEYVFNNHDRGNELITEIKASTPERAQELARALINEVVRLKKEGAFEDEATYLKEVISFHSFSIEALEEAKKVMQETGEDFDLGLFWPSAPERANEMKISETALQHIGYVEGETDWITAGIDLAAEKEYNSINLFHAIINQRVIDYAHQKGLRVFAWVVNDQEKAEKLLGMGVDKIITEK